MQSEKGAVVSKKAQRLSSSSAATQNLTPPTTAASRHSRWQPSPPARTTTSTSRTPNGIVALPSASSRSSRRRSRKAHISRSKASCAAVNTRARKTDTKQRAWEIRVASILKLDQAEKVAPEDQEHEDAPQEESAASTFALSLSEAQLAAGLRSLGGSRYELRIDPAIP